MNFLDRPRNRVSAGEWIGIGIMGLGALVALVSMIIFFVSGIWWAGVILLLVALAALGLVSACTWESLYG